MGSEQGPSSLVQANGESSRGNQESELQKMVAEMVKQAMEAERARPTASGGSSQAGGHSVSGRCSSNVNSPTCGMTGLGSLLLAYMLHGPIVKGH